VNQLQIYRLQDEQRATRLQELTNNDNPTALDSELGVLRLLHEEALNANQPIAAVQIAKVIGQLATATENAKIRRGELLAKSVVLGIAQKIAQVLSSNIANRFIGWEDVLDEVKSEVLTLVCEAKNPEP
jgi:hypothetical protein